MNNETNTVENREQADQTVLEITEHKPAEEQRRRSERELADFFENANSGMHWVGADGGILWTNRAEKLRTLNKHLEQRVAERTAELERQNQRLQQLANQLTDAKQRERINLAKTLHDGLQQLLVAARMQLLFCTGDKVAETVDRLGNLLDQAIDASRTLSCELSPPAWQHCALPEAIQWLAQWVRSNHRFEIQVKADKDFPKMPDHIKTFLFHAVRELLLNAVKHSAATAAHVELRKQQSQLVRITVADDGRGFDPRRLEDEQEEPHGLGLFSVRERLAAFGGKFQIDSSPGAGARFVLTLTVADEGAPTPSNGSRTLN